eukprot:GHUV01055995.1.p2 GENE.GHUV01055995.1~~GHUV01055995.1.p2  ORF type:complete len:118 (+),score=27.04 GHUV01055995.1:245-598(+)
MLLLQHGLACEQLPITRLPATAVCLPVKADAASVVHRYHQVLALKYVCHWQVADVSAARLPGGLDRNIASSVCYQVAMRQHGTCRDTDGEIRTLQWILLRQTAISSRQPQTFCITQA